MSVVLFSPPEMRSPKTARPPDFNPILFGYRRTDPPEMRAPQLRAGLIPYCSDFIKHFQILPRDLAADNRLLHAPNAVVKFYEDAAGTVPKAVFDSYIFQGDGNTELNGGLAGDIDFFATAPLYFTLTTEHGTSPVTELRESS